MFSQWQLIGWIMGEETDAHCSAWPAQRDTTNIIFLKVKGSPAFVEQTATDGGREKGETVRITRQRWNYKDLISRTTWINLCVLTSVTCFKNVLATISYCQHFSFISHYQPAHNKPSSSRLCIIRMKVQCVICLSLTFWFWVAHHNKYLMDCCEVW